MRGRAPAEILVGAGTNGAGKSSIVQPFLEAGGGRYFNPDEETRRLVEKGLDLSAANAQAWKLGYDALRRTIDEGGRFAFETTLGGQSIAFELMRALALGHQVQIVFVGLSSVDLHIQRVAERVLRGGHDIPEDAIRKRYDGSRKNLLAFIGTEATIRVWDNSQQTPDGIPAPFEVMFIERKVWRLGARVTLQTVPQWTKPLVLRAMKMLPSR